LSAIRTPVGTPVVQTNVVVGGAFNTRQEPLVTDEAKLVALATGAHHLKTCEQIKRLTAGDSFVTTKVAAHDEVDERVLPPVLVAEVPKLVGCHHVVVAINIYEQCVRLAFEKTADTDWDTTRFEHSALCEDTNSQFLGWGPVQAVAGAAYEGPRWHPMFSNFLKLI
jgi:hypothetical protein